MSGKDRPRGLLLGVEWELGVGPEAPSSRLSVMSGVRLGARLKTLFSGLNVMSGWAPILSSRGEMCEPTGILSLLSIWDTLVRRDMCRDLGDRSDYDHYRCPLLLRLLESWEGNRKSKVSGRLLSSLNFLKVKVRFWLIIAYLSGDITSRRISELLINAYLQAWSGDSWLSNWHLLNFSVMMDEIVWQWHLISWWSDVLKISGCGQIS